jgi:ribonuclease HI
MRFVVYSDGGGEGGGGAAAACIVDSSESDARRAYCLYLGSATNNEAEISAFLLGVSVCIHLSSDSKPQVEWHTDSEYTLKSATMYIHGWQRNGWKTSKKEPVKNQGLWRCWLELSRSVRIEGNHVRGHSGHSENELCDLACNWVRVNGLALLENEGNGAGASIGDLEWRVFDGRSFLEAMRGEPEEPEFEMLTELVSSAPATTALANGGSVVNYAERNFVERLRKALSSAPEGSESDALSELVAEVRTAIAKYERKK